MEDGDGSSRPSEKLSIVVAASAGPRFLESCLASLRRDADAGEADVVVVSNYPVSELDDRYRFAKFLALPQTSTVPALRAAGIAQAGA